MQETRTRYDGTDGNARELIRRTKWVTRRRFTPEEKVRIVIEGIGVIGCWLLRNGWLSVGASEVPTRSLRPFVTSPAA